MKTYLAGTGTLFGLLAVVHVWRMTEETHLAKDPWYLVITGVAAALAGWAWWVGKGVRRP